MASWWVRHIYRQLMLVENHLRVVQDFEAICLAGRCSPCLVSPDRLCRGCARVCVWSSLILAFGVACAPLLASERGAHLQNLLRCHLL